MPTVLYSKILIKAYELSSLELNGRWTDALLCVVRLKEMLREWRVAQAGVRSEQLEEGGPIVTLKTALEMCMPVDFLDLFAEQAREHIVARRAEVQSLEKAEAPLGLDEDVEARR